MTYNYDPFSEEIKTVDTTSTSFSTDIIFSALDYNTINWTNGIIVKGEGEFFDISAGSIDISGNTYIYFDGTKVLKSTTDPKIAQQGNNIVVGTCTDVDVGKKAMYKIDGNIGLGVYIDGDNIKAGSITADLIEANSITADKIKTSDISIGIWKDAGVLAKLDSVGSSEVNFNYASSGSKGGRYNAWLESSELSTGVNPSNGVIMDKDGIRGYGSGLKTFEVKSLDGSAFFRGNIYAESGTFTGNIISTATITGGEFTTQDGTDDKVTIKDGRISFYDGVDYVGAFKSRAGEILVSDNFAIGGELTSYLDMELNKSIRLKNDDGISGYIKMEDISTSTSGKIYFSDGIWIITDKLSNTSITTQKLYFSTSDYISRDSSGDLLWKGDIITIDGLKLSGGTMTGSIDMGGNSISNINQMIVNTGIVPSSDEGADLGTSSTGWNNLFIDDIWATDSELDIHSGVDFNNNSIRKMDIDSNHSMDGKEFLEMREIGSTGEYFPVYK